MERCQLAAGRQEGIRGVRTLSGGAVSSCTMIGSSPGGSCISNKGERREKSGLEDVKRESKGKGTDKVCLNTFV